MARQDESTTILKSNDPEKIIVFHASSTENQIRFYFNRTQYIAAVDGENDTYSIRLGEQEDNEEENKKSISAKIKENKKDFTKIVILTLLFTTFTLVISIFLATIIENLFIYFLFICVVSLILSMYLSFLLESSQVSYCLKSKHSAEHMMANFIEENKRLPRNMEEIRKSSRFSKDCGSRESVKGIAKNFVKNIISYTLAYIAGSFVLFFTKNNAVSILILAITLFISYVYISEKILKKFNRMLKFIEDILTHIEQCANTTRRVKDKDIFLAYFAARLWLQFVYPEFYIEEEDFFWTQYYGVNNKIE